MRQFRNVIWIVAVGVLSFSSIGTNENGKMLSPAELRQDVESLRKALERYHPGLYWYTSKQEFDLTWDSLQAKVKQPLSEDDFFALLLPAVAKVKCAHTLFYPSAGVMKGGTRFPLDLKFIGSKVYLMASTQIATGIPSGSALLAINGQSITEILNRLFPGLQAQGGNRGWKYAVLENDFQNYYYYLIGHEHRFEIQYINRKTGLVESAIIEGSDDERLKAHWKNWYPVTDGAPMRTEYPGEQGTAILTIKSFVRGRAKAYGQDFDKLIDQFFEEIREKEIKKLIIDVRGNEGGNNPEKLYSYIAKENDINTGAKKGDRKRFIPPAKNNFDGQVVVLANKRSISAQETFVSIFKANKRGSVVGEPTPGCYRRLCGGKKHRLLLPNSGFEIRIPMYPSIRTYDDEVPYGEGEGIPPDFEIRESIDDILGGKDAAMEFALGL